MIKKGVYINYEDDKEIRYLCPNCKQEQVMTKESFYAYPSSVLLCKSCCKKPHIVKQGGVQLPFPPTENDFTPLMRFYYSTIQP